MKNLDLWVFAILVMIVAYVFLAGMGGPTPLEGLR